MRKLYACLLAALAFPLFATAAPGDTTWVQANNVQLNYYNNFDTSILFPDSSVSYRKIYMIATIGKYACPGSPQYCGDWDYTVQTFFMGISHPDTLELGRLITPYAHTGWYRFAANWTQRYIFDVTDYYPILRDSGTVRIHYSGYSGGFTANIRFAFIEGTPERNVLRVDRLWHGNFNYGHGSTPINTALVPESEIPPIPAVSAALKMNITGHGGDDNACAEFCPNFYRISMNGSQVAQQEFFREDCSQNELYPQSGTWIYARANWCPGALVRTISHELPLSPGAAPFNLTMSFPAYTSTTSGGGSPASYTIESTVVYYGTANKNTDASLEDIIAPTKAEYHWRENPISGRPILSIRNSGANAITSMKILYGVDGKLENTYNWNGNIPSFSTQEITLPPLPQLRLAAGDYGFHANIAEVNGAADEDPTNNSLNSTFAAAPQWPSKLQIQLATNDEPLPSNASISQTAWRIEDAAGNIVQQCNNCAISSVCDTMFTLPDGAYRLVVSDSNYLGYYDIPTGTAVGKFTGTGLSQFPTTSGALRVYDANLGITVPMHGYYSGNFGAGFVEEFTVGEPLGVPTITSLPASMKAFPNPAGQRLTVVVDGLQNSEGFLTLHDMLGREVLHQAYTHGIVQMNVSELADGVYLLSYENQHGQHLQQRVSIRHDH
ncbi:MAG: T9SS type A sorting domain-containing protein [Bacteroidetes bacterium]|nr:T9SS type A sorting domain-containing protein [Bacteroidota bacterium]